MFSPIAQEKGYYDVFWALLGICGGLWVFTTVIMVWLGETRHDVLLRKKADCINCESDAKNVTVAPQYRRVKFSEMVKIALTRPLILLATEPIIL